MITQSIASQPIVIKEENKKTPPPPTNNPFQRVNVVPGPSSSLSQ